MVVQLHKNTTPFSFVHWGNPQQWLFHVPMNCWRRYAERSKQLLLKQRWSRITGRNTPETSIHQQITNFFNFLLFCLKTLQSESLDNGVEVAFRSGCQMTPRLDTLNPRGSDLDHFGHSKKKQVKTWWTISDHLRLYEPENSVCSHDFFGDFCYGEKKDLTAEVAYRVRGPRPRSWGWVSLKGHGCTHLMWNFDMTIKYQMSGVKSIWRQMSDVN